MNECLHVQSCKLAHMSGIHCHMGASWTRGCPFMYFYYRVDGAIVQYLHFKLRMYPDITGSFFQKGG